MKESEFFRPIKEEVERRGEESEVKPLTADEHQEADAETLPASEHGEDEVEVRPMTPKDHWLSLRQSIQEKTADAPPTGGNQERIKLLHELVTPELVAEYKQLLRDFNERTKKSETRSQREFIDINGEEFSARIENWIAHLIAEVKSKKEEGFDENNIEELAAQCWLYFNSISNVMNTNSLERDVNEFCETNKVDTMPKKEQGEQRKKLTEELRERYPLEQEELEILVDVIMEEHGGDQEYSLKMLAETLGRLYNEYNLKERKGKIGEIAMGYFLSRGLESFAPWLLQDIISENKFNAIAGGGFLALSMVPKYIEKEIDVRLEEVMNELSHEINERITNSLFFQEFEFIHEKSLGEVFEVLERGKQSTEQILKETVTQLAPTMVEIGASVGFLTSINPILGGIGGAGLPIMYWIAKKQNEKISPMYKKEAMEGEKIVTRLSSIKSGFEEVKTSPDIQSIAQHAKAQMNARDILSMKRSIEERKASFTRTLPFYASTLAAGAVGYGMQEAGMISGGAVLSTTIYSGRLYEPVQELVDLYFNRFSRYVQDIQRMEEVLGEYEKLDLPEGEKEEDRVPVSQLENFDISVKDLRYKNILRGVNLDIKQGEFVTIAGASGAGKSTLLRNLVGLYKPDGGDIEIGGHSNESIKKYGDESIYSVMSYCNQNPQIFSGMTLRENLLLWSKREIGDEQIKDILKDLHLEKFNDKLDEEVKYLSGGERVRIGVARTLIKGAKIMLLDEPTASLDSQGAAEVRNAISEISEKYPDTTIICVSHDEGLINLGERKINMEELQN